MSNSVLLKHVDDDDDAKLPHTQYVAIFVLI